MWSMGTTVNNKGRYIRDKKEAFPKTENFTCLAHISEVPGMKASQILYDTDYYYFAEPYNITRYKLLSVSVCMYVCMYKYNNII